MSGNGNSAKIVVIGGGVSGMTAAIEASEVGKEVVLVEKRPYLGGRVVQLNQYFPKLCPPVCGLEISLKRIRTSTRIQTLTSAEVEEIAGEPGRYTVKIRKNPRYVNTKCTACGKCAEACTSERDDEFNYGMSKTKAAYLPFDMAHPFRYVLDKDACSDEECKAIAEACPYDAIDLEMKPETVEVTAGAVIWATGWDPYDATKLENLGFGKLPNVITNVMMERLAARYGPTEGKIVRPSDQKEIESIAFVQCAGSRDVNYQRFCSGVCCLASLKQARYVREQYPDAKITIFKIDIRAPGRLEDFYQTSQEDEKLTILKGKVAKISEVPGEGDLVVEAEDTLTGTRLKEKFNMVVLATGITPVGVGAGVKVDGVSKDEDGFLTGEQERPGFIGAGCAKRPVEVAASVRDATSAALKAVQACVE